MLKLSSRQSRFDLANMRAHKGMASLLRAQLICGIHCPQDVGLSAALKRGLDHFTEERRAIRNRSPRWLLDTIVLVESSVLPNAGCW